MRSVLFRALIHSTELSMAKRYDPIGEYVRNVFANSSKFPLIKDKEVERQLFIRYVESGRTDKVLREKLILSNLRAPFSIVIKYIKNNPSKSSRFEDLISVANCGLIKAVEKFDPSEGVVFSTYLFPVVWRDVDNEAIVLDYHVKVNVRAVKMQRSLLAQLAKRETTYDALKSGEKRLIDVLSCDRRSVSLNQPIRGGGHSRATCELASLDEWIDIPAPSSEDDALETLQILADNSRLSTLEQQIIDSRLGASGRIPNTVREAGELIGWTERKARDHHSTAFRKLSKTATKLRVKGLL